jgi:hypothetical protein
VIRLTFEGMPEAVAAFQGTPAEMTAEARDTVADAARQAADTIRGQYPSLSGTMRAGVQAVTGAGGDFVAPGRVVSTSPEATWWEYGTAMRHTGTGAFRGRVTPHPVFIRTMIATRARLDDAWRALLTRFGLRPIG